MRRGQDGWWGADMAPAKRISESTIFVRKVCLCFNLNLDIKVYVYKITSR